MRAPRMRRLSGEAIATEAGITVPFDGRERIREMFVGVGASRVRQLFKKPQELAEGYGECIVFIDELDAIGRTGRSASSGAQETNTTQNHFSSR